MNFPLEKRNIPGLIVLLVSLGMLIPGLYLDLITLDISFDAILGRLEVYNETRSILGTISDLFDNDNAFVGFLILFFSVIVPVLKAIALLLVVSMPNLPARPRILRFVNLISKWSMADVFVVGVFIAFLSLQSNKNVSAELHEGFFWFLGYCLLSILAAQMIRVKEADLNPGVEIS